MARGVGALSPREKEVLRHLLRGHDAKSIARELELSVHTINEHLREARRKLEVSSSRAAARLLHEAERVDPDFFADKQLGVGAPISDMISRSLNWFGGGMLVMSLLIAAAAIASAFGSGSKPRPGEPPKVVATIPKPGATIKPGQLLLSVTFDRPMQAGSYSFAGDPELAPQNCGKPEQSSNGRTYSMRCAVSPGREYEIWFNRGQFMNFRSVEGVSAQPYRLIFNVSR